MTALEQSRQVDLSLFVLPFSREFLGQGTIKGCSRRYIGSVLAGAFLGQGELEVRHTVVSPSEVLRHVEVLLQLSTDLPLGDGHHLQLGLSFDTSDKAKESFWGVEMLDLVLLGHGSDLLVFVLFGFRAELAVLVRKPCVVAPLGRIAGSAAYAITSEVLVPGDDIAIFESIFTTKHPDLGFAAGFEFAGLPVDVVRLVAGVLV